MHIRSLPGASTIKRLVSKKKLRFTKDGFDLDLSYITPRLIAMGYPSTGAESYFRNPAPQVQAFIERYHSGHCKVYNLCIEKAYGAAVLGLPETCVEQHGCFDHNPAPLICIAPFCESAKRWLDTDPRNVVAVHCKAGKGRTGMMISSLLVYMGEQPDAAASLSLFGRMRTANEKGVTIPSQQRYVRYAERLVDRELDTPPPPLGTPPLYTLQTVTLLHPPDFAMEPKTTFTLEIVHEQARPPPEACIDVGHAAGGGTLMSSVDDGAAAVTSPAWRSWKVYDHLKMGGSSAASASGAYVLSCPAGQQPLLAGDVKLVLSTPKGKLAQCWFHTCFVTANGKDKDKDSAATLTLTKLELDKLCKDKKDKLVAKGFALELQMQLISGPEVERKRTLLREEAHARCMTVTVEVELLGESGDEETDDDDDDDEGAPPLGVAAMARKPITVTAELVRVAK